MIEVAPAPLISDRLFELAWEHGHSSGYREVAIYYDEFAELLKD